MFPQPSTRKPKKPRLDDEVRFLRSWIEKPLAMGAVMPSGKPLARTMAQYVDPHGDGPVIELGPGTGPITNALVERGVDPRRLVLLEYSPNFCALLRDRFPQATVVQGDAYALRNALVDVLRQAFNALAPRAPFIQFTYSVAPPIPKSLPGIVTEASERIWMNVPPARVWVYRKG